MHLRYPAFLWVALAVFANGCASPPNSKGVPPAREILVRGGSDESFSPQVGSAAKATADARSYDVVIVGGGVSGLTAGLYLTDRNKSVLILEKEKSLGGLSVGGPMAGMDLRY